jgi:hypothetical protein
MPLALQALLPIAVLLLAAWVVHMRPRRAENSSVATMATGVAAVIALVELLRLAPGEHVDVPYVTTFPYGDLLIRLDGLSLSFATVTLATAALLMLVRQQDRSDRRDPWTAWLLTSAAVTALIMAGNLLLLYILLQVLTLAWSGAVDETAPRRRALRLTLQIADIGLLLAAASAIQSVGTSSFSGVPSDTFGLATFVLMLLPVVVRIGAIAWAARRPLASVAFGPAIAWLAPAAYILLRLLALMGGRLPDRPTAVALFGGGVLAALVFAVSAIRARSMAQVTALLLAAQVALALALSSGNEPLLTIASTWLWLLVIPLAGLVSVRLAGGSPGETLTLIQLSLVPASVGFVGVWLGALSLNARGLGIGIVPVALVVLAGAVAALTRIAVPRTIELEAAAFWAAALLVIGAIPIIAMNPLVIPAASTVRLVPNGTVSASPLGLTTNFGTWPALAVSVIASLLLGLVAWMARVKPARLTLPRVAVPRWPSFAHGRTLTRVTGLRQWRAFTAIPGWSRFIPWAAFALVVVIALARP